MTLNKIIQGSGVQFYNTSSVYCVVCSPPRAKSAVLYGSSAAGASGESVGRGPAWLGHQDEVQVEALRCRAGREPSSPLVLRAHFVNRETAGAEGTGLCAWTLFCG